MSRKKKRKPDRIIHQSAGPLPSKFAAQYADCLLVFSDASRKAHGGLAAVIFDGLDAEPVVACCTVPLMGSNELELQAALFALLQAERFFPGRQLALFTDNQDAASRLNRAKALGMGQDGSLAEILPALDVAHSLSRASIRWVKGHSSCRGNTLADRYARDAATAVVQQSGN